MSGGDPGPAKPDGLCSEGVCPDGLLCAITLDPTSLPRNRYFWVYSEARARRAHGRAYSLRRLSDDIMERLARYPCSVAEEGRGLRIAYRDEALTLVRRIHLGALETSLLRLLLARGATHVPALLRASHVDRLRVAAALERIRRHPRLPDPSGWGDVLSPMDPATPSNTTE